VDARPVLGKCPVCDEKMVISRLTCPHCGTAVEGRFQSCKFCALTPQQRDMVEIFLKVRGNIKEVERELGISYPTVRNRLEDIVRSLGYRLAPAPEEERLAAKRKEVLDALSAGEITAEEAAKRLRSLR